MKKLMCTVLIIWLPIFMVTANAMRVQMATNTMHGETQMQSTMPCHAASDQDSVQSHHCMSCPFCAIATSAVNIGFIPLINIPSFQSFKLSFVDDALQSIDHAPLYRPPILH
jgi:hypothetical protein